MADGQESGLWDDLTEPLPIREGLNRFTAADRATARRRRRWALVGLAAGLTLLSGLLLLAGYLPMAALSLIVTLVCLGGSQWLWYRSRFCGRCGVRTKSAFSGPERFWCPACSHLTTSARATLGPAGRFDAGNLLYGQDESGAVSVTCSVVLMSVRDRAQAMQILCENGELRISEVCDKQTYKIVPPPVWLYPRIVRIFQALTGLDPELVGQRQEGSFDLFIAAHRIPCTVRIEPVATGGSLELQLLNPECPGEDRPGAAAAVGSG